MNIDIWAAPWGGYYIRINERRVGPRIMTEGEAEAIAEWLRGGGVTDLEGER